MAAHFRIHLLEESNWVRLWQLLKLATEGAYRHNCLSVAKGAAYSALLSFFPVLTTVAALLVQARADSASLPSRSSSMKWCRREPKTWCAIFSWCMANVPSRCWWSRSFWRRGPHPEPSSA